MKPDNPKIQILLTLGSPPNTRKWPDYLAKYDFSAEDVPALLAVFTDQDIEQLSSDHPEVWAPLYAWRILGQLGSKDAIEPIVHSFDTLHEDDWALGELCGVIGMIGPAAIPTLVEFWRQPGKDEFSYVMAMDALCEIAKQHPPSRDQVIDIYIDYMNEPNKLAYNLNGLLMACLMDLKAASAIDGIRRLFALNCVDISCAGDLEEVEIALGLRMKRSMPKPSREEIYGHGNPFASMAEEFDDEIDEGAADREAGIIEIIEDDLLCYGSDESILGASELDGYFAALACAPETIMPSSWMPVIWGGDEFSPEWESEQEFTRFSQAILAHYNSVTTDFQSDDYQPLFMEGSQNDSLLLVVDDWCEGFLRGLTLWGELSTQDSKQLKYHLQAIRIFGTTEGIEALQSMKDEEIHRLQAGIQPSVAALNQYFFKPVKTADATFIRPSPKVGRNQPCPCGSGKKYKKCCGLN
jgi:uncharacterized protein